MVAGVWSHFASADEPGNPSIEAQLAAFKEALAVAESAGITPQVRHIANTAAALDVPQARYDLVRIGGGSYGLATLPGGAPAWLRPAMTLRARLVAREAGARGDRGVLRAPVHHDARDDARAGAARLRGRDTARRDRPAARRSRAAAGGRSRARSAWTSWSIDFGDEPVAEGDEVVLFGPGDDGEPTAQEWGEALGTISYEIVTGIGARVPRSHHE